jgi:hypothetical protein
MVVSSAPATELLLAPTRWSRPLEWLSTLSAYIAGVPADHDVTLYLDGRSADLDPLVLRAIVEGVCTYVSSGRPFASIGLLEGTVDAPVAAAPVSDPAELAERLGIELAELADDPAEIVAHGRWAKALVDAIQAAVDKSKFAAAPRPALGDEPLVTVRIPTYGSTDALVNRSIPSVLAGAYRNVEVIVCSDGPQPHAREAVATIGDARVRYLELDERPEYPSRLEAFWQTAGIYAVNHALDEARGALIAPLDHDDAFTHNHIPRLLDALRGGGHDFAYGQAMTEYPDGDWRLLGSAPLAYGEIIHASVMYSPRLSHMRMDPHSWLLHEPGDWNMWRRIRDTGAAIHHVPEPIAVHFKERSSIGHQQRDDEAETAVTAADILGTAARELLRVSSPGRGARLRSAASAVTAG